MKFFNSDKSGFLSFVAKRMKALFALFFIIAGTSSVWGQNPELSWTYASDMSGWADAVGKSEYTFIRQDVVFAGNNYTHYLDIEFQSAGTDNYKLIEDGKNWYGMETTIPYQCKWWEWKSGAGNTAFQHNAGKYRMYINAYNDQRRVSVTGIIVTIDQPVKNADGTYTITGSFANANANIEPNGQKVRLCQVEFTQGLTGRYNGKNADNVELISVDAIEQTGETFTVITPALTEGATYTCRAVVVDDKIGDAFSESVTFTAEAATQAPEYSATIVADNSVAEQVSLSSSLTITNGVTVENIGNATCQFSYKAADAADWQNIGGSVAYNNGSAALSEQSLAAGDYVFRATWTLDAVEIASAESATVTINAAGEPQPTVTDLYIFGVNDNWSNPSDEWKCTSVSQNGNVYTWDWSPAPKTFNVNTYFKVGAKNADNDGIDDNNNYGPSGSDVLLNFDGVQSIIQIVVNSKESKAFYVSEETKISKIVFDKSALTVEFHVSEESVEPSFSANITADASVAEQVSLASTLTETVAGTDLATATCVFQYKAADAGDDTYTVMTGDGLSYSGEGATRTATLSQDMAAGDYVFRAVWTYNSAEVANAVTETVTIPSDTPTPTDIEFYVRGEKIGCTPSEGGNCWGVASEEFKATSKEGNVYVWDWSLQPKLMVGPFKIADANFSDANNYGLGNKTEIKLTDGKWTGTLQVNTANGDMIISEPGWNVSKITFDYDTKILEIFATPVFKDIWFRSSIVENGWGDDISDPIGSDVSPKYQGQTTDGKVYTWDWSGSKAVTLESGTEFKFGEYKGSSWAASGYAPNGQASVTSADFGKEISVQVAAGNFSAGEKITITKITLDTETPKLVLEGEKFTERFPVTVNKVNGENGSVDTDPSDITNMAIGETVTVTATANEGYVALFEATSGCVMTDGSADNIKVFEITEANPVITVTFQVQCETVEPRFTISGQFNAEILDADGLYQGSPVVSDEAETADGYWSDGARYIQLTANSVTANYFDWECTGYAIDGVAQEAVPEISWTDKDKTSARAELSLPGTYTFVCKAKCNETDEWTNSEELTITAPAPEMGFDGTGIVGSAWDHASAGIDGQGLMTRQPGTMIWKSRVLNVANFGGEFVVIQRYKTLGCNDFSENSSDESSRGWTGNGECGDMGLTRSDNKVNRAKTLQFMNVEQPGDDANFKTANGGNWTAGENGTDLQLVVTMTGWDSYTVALEEVSQECTTPADNFAISVRLNQGAGAPFEGNLVASDSNTATGGYFADGFRTVTLTTTQVADTYEWKLVGYAIDGNAQTTADLTALATITNGDAQTATALLSLPGDYTFQCTAACTDGTHVNSATVTISTYPEMGFDGPIGTPASVSENGWNHAWAGQSGNGLLVRENGSLKWSLTFVYQGVGSTPNDFVVIQRYKRGCVTAPDGGEQGWAGFTECGVIVPGEPDFWGNKINASIIDLASGLGYASTTEGDNFRANDLAAEQGWVAGVTELTLTVTMTDWDSYTVELAKKQEQIFANYSSNNEAMGTVAMKVGDISIAKGANITGYIGEQVTLTATPAQGYKVASWEINGKVTESDKTTISPTLSGAGLKVVVTFERDCYAGVAYDLTGGGVICADGGSTELSLNTLNNVTYQLYKDGEPYGTAVEGNGEAAKWTISQAGTYTAKSYDSRFEECEEQAIDMNGSAFVTSVPALEITVNPGKDVHLTVLQARSFTADVPVDWSITDVTRNGDYCVGDGYMISSQTDTSLVAKFLCIGTAKITATMKAPNQNCKAEVTVHQNGAEMENCAPEPEDVQ